MSPLHIFTPLAFIRVKGIQPVVLAVRAITLVVTVPVFDSADARVSALGAFMPVVYVMHSLPPTYII